LLGGVFFFFFFFFLSVIREPCLFLKVLNSERDVLLSGLYKFRIFLTILRQLLDQ